MRTVTVESVERAVARLCKETNISLPAGLRQAMASASETFAPARNLLDILRQNADLAKQNGVPVCQDTGLACVFLDVGQDARFDGDVISAVNRGVATGYGELLRKSVVADPLRRDNTGDNTPAAVYIEYVPGDAVTVTVAPKGFGSENASRIAMLKPSDGEQGVVDFVVDTVRAAGGNPCPPVVLGVGIGGTFDKCAYLAKRALLREVGEPNADPFYARLERRILAEVNALGIGPQGFGGDTTALGVAIIAAPTHIAGLPVAVNVNCHVARHGSVSL